MHSTPEAGGAAGAPRDPSAMQQQPRRIPEEQLAATEVARGYGLAIDGPFERHRKIACEDAVAEIPKTVRLLAQPERAAIHTRILRYKAAPVGRVSIRGKLCLSSTSS